MMHVLRSAVLLIAGALGALPAPADGLDDRRAIDAAAAVARELHASDNFYDQILGAGTLVDLGDREALQFLVDMLSHPDLSLQRSAIDTLLEVAHPDAVDVLHRLVTTDGQQRFAKFISESLASRPREHLGSLLLDILALEDEWITRHALQALGRMRLAADAPAVRELAADAGRSAVSRAYAHYVLSGAAEQEATLQALVDIAVAGSAEAREIAAIGLGRIDTQRAREALEGMHGALDPRVRLAVLTSEAGFGDKSALAELTAMIARGGGQDAPTAAATLRRMPPRIAAQITAVLLECCELETGAAVRLLESWGWIDADAGPVLRWGLASTDPMVRMQAAWLAGQRTERARLDALLVLLDDADDGVRGMAAWSVVRLAGSGGVRSRRALGSNP